MGKNQSSGDIYREQQQDQLSSLENSSSNYSFSKNRKNQRRARKKKITKIVHTVCFFKVTEEGGIQAIYRQQTGETTFINKKTINKLAIRQYRDHNSRAVEIVKKADFSKKVYKPMQVKIEENIPLTVSQSYTFNPYCVC